MITNKVPSADFISTLKALVARSRGIDGKDTTKTQEIEVGITNCLWFWGTQIEPITDAPKWEILCGVVRQVFASKLVDGTLLKTSLEFSLLCGAGLSVESEISFTSRLRRIYTGLVYKQQKYNLLREETEGYAKLLAVLCSMPVKAVIARDGDAHYTSLVNSLIGRTS